jgi:hypothetical protein
MGGREEGWAFSKLGISRTAVGEGSMQVQHSTIYQIPRLAGNQLEDQPIHRFAHLMQRGHGQICRSRESVDVSNIQRKKIIC